jgi:hypothetical protein
MLVSIDPPKAVLSATPGPPWSFLIQVAALLAKLKRDYMSVILAYLLAEYKNGTVNPYKGLKSLLGKKPQNRLAKHSFDALKSFCTCQRLMSSLLTAQLKRSPVVVLRCSVVLNHHAPLRARSVDLHLSHLCSVYCASSAVYQLSKTEDWFAWPHFYFTCSTHYFSPVYSVKAIWKHPRA